MDKYLKYLLQDLYESIHRARQQALSVGPDDFVDTGMDWVTSFASYSEVDVTAFPPVHRLTSEQLGRVLHAIRRLLASMCIESVLPANFPPDREYRLLLGQWTQPFVLKLHENQSLDFCELDMKTCPYGEQFCYCKNFQTDWEDM